MSDLKTNTKYIVENFYTSEVGQNLKDYDKSHTQRIKLTTDHLLKYEIKDKVVCDMGCGTGIILKNLDSTNELIGVDGAKIELEDNITRYQCNFDYDQFSETIGEQRVDHMLSFETFEHLTNPYNFIFECKKILKEGGVFHISYPTMHVQHNTFYPGLLWPSKSFLVFMSQMAFKLEKQFEMPTRFGGVHFYVFENRPWEEVKMMWPHDKSKEKFRGQPPHVQVNL